MLLDERNLDDKITVQNYLFSPIGYLWGGKFRKNIFPLLSYWCICIICLLQYERYLFGYVIIWNDNPFKQYVCLVLVFVFTLSVTILVLISVGILSIDGIVVEGESLPNISVY